MLDTINPTAAEIGEFATSLRNQRTEVRSQKVAGRSQKSRITQREAQLLADLLKGQGDMAEETDWPRLEALALETARFARLKQLEAACDEAGVVTRNR